MSASTANKKDVQRERSPTLQDTASYIADLSAQLGAMADAHGLALVSSLLRLVTHEAARASRDIDTHKADHA